jgi:hypothetical protein
MDSVFDADLELRISLLAPISRGVHLNGPVLHARRLVELWQVESDDVPLRWAFRLLEVDAVRGAIMRTLMVTELPSDPRRWVFPNLSAMLPELHALSWAAMIDGSLCVDATKGLRGTRRCAVLPAELPRLARDWKLCRLCAGERDVYLDVRVRRAPSKPAKMRWRPPPGRGALAAAMRAIARQYPPGARPAFAEVWQALKVRLGDVSRQQARDAIADYAPWLRGRRGYHSKSPD